MIKNNLAIYLLLSSMLSLAQSSKTTLEKPAITPEVFGKFESIISATISNDGNYVIYSINDPFGNKGGIYLNAIHSDLNSHKVGYGQFTNDSRYYIYASSDSLFFFDLKSRRQEYIQGVATHKQTDKCIAYLLKSNNKLVIRNFENNKETVFNDVKDYYFNTVGTFLVLVSSVNGGLELVNLQNQKKIKIWSPKGTGSKTSNFVFSKIKNSLAFLVEEKERKSIWYCRRLDDVAIEVPSTQSESSNTISIDGIDFRGFSSDEKNLFIKIREKAKPKPEVGVDVWSYTDAVLQSKQLKLINELKGYLGLLRLDNGAIVQLENENKKMIGGNDENVLIADTKFPTLQQDEWYWNKNAQSSVYLFNIMSGSETLISGGISSQMVNSYRLSPTGKYIIYYDDNERNYFSYETATGIKRNITEGSGGIWTTYVKNDVPVADQMGAVGMTGRWEIAGWASGGNSVLLYDQCDIYSADLLGNHKAINITNGFGRKNNIELRIAIEEGLIWKNKQSILLSAFNRETKYDGFCRIKLGEVKDPQILLSGPFVFKGTEEDDRGNIVLPIKAKKSDVFVIRRMSASESPNYFWTTNFKQFNKITDVHPERNFNWLTTELVTWKVNEGTASQGILYKPENFDSTKKYPLIFYYYENSSEGLNDFFNPEVSLGTLNIPYYVSNGYLVFTPDMHYEIGHPGQSVVNTIVSAANYLSNFSYVDVNRMGIQGHSRGGWETNFIITHTNLFAAAVSASGMSDYVSLYNQTREMTTGASRQTALEMSYQRIGATLWESPELFIENSPIFKADNVRTPVLMMANKNDEDVPFQQGLEFFNGLRRLGKRAWMLQYDDGSHMVFGRSAEDYTIRMKQFFDHYLKDSACPRWMLYGVPASEKGNPDALKLVYEKDPKTGKWLTPKEGGLLTDEEKKKVEALKHRKPVTVTME